MGYISFYRKWRPQDFDQVVGQDYNIKAIRNAISKNRLSHSYIFCGPKGTGKTSTARILAKAVNCKLGMTEKPCNKCDSCISISNGNSVDVIEIDAASNRGINEIRELREKVKYLPNVLRKKVYIIDEVHMLTTEAFNALLKVLEEPPEHVLFIMATTEPNKVIPTIMSRCQRFDFFPITQGEIKNRLKMIAGEEKISISDSALSLAAKYADGSLRDADGILEQLAAYSDSNIQDRDVVSLLGMVDFDLLNRFAGIIHSGNVNDCLEIIDKIISNSYNLKVFVSEFLDYLYDLYIYKNYKNPSGIVNIGDDYGAILKSQAERIQKEEIEFYIEIFTDLLKQIKWGEGSKIYFKSTVLKAINFIVLDNEGMMKKDKLIEVHFEKLRNRIDEIDIDIKNLKNTISDNKKTSIDESVNLSRENNEIDNLSKVVESARMIQKNDEKNEKESIYKTKPDSNIDKYADTEERIKKVTSKQPGIMSDIAEKGSLEISSIIKKQDKILEFLKKKKISVYAMFKESYPLRIDGNTLYFILKNDLKWHKEHLNKPENANLISEIIKEVIGKKFKVLFELGDIKKAGIEELPAEDSYDIPAYSENAREGIIKDDNSMSDGIIKSNKSEKNNKKINENTGDYEVSDNIEEDSNKLKDAKRESVYEYFEKKFRIKE